MKGKNRKPTKDSEIKLREELLAIDLRFDDAEIAEVERVIKIKIAAGEDVAVNEEKLRQLKLERDKTANKMTKEDSDNFRSSEKEAAISSAQSIGADSTFSSNRLCEASHDVLRRLTNSGQESY